jgi:hypothetical protein
MRPRKEGKKKASKKSKKKKQKPQPQDNQSAKDERQPNEHAREPAFPRHIG